MELDLAGVVLEKPIRQGLFMGHMSGSRPKNVKIVQAGLVLQGLTRESQYRIWVTRTRPGSLGSYSIEIEEKEPF